jgi:hypothetical protein
VFTSNSDYERNNLCIVETVGSIVRCNVIVWRGILISWNSDGLLRTAKFVLHQRFDSPLLLTDDLYNKY